MVSSMYLKPQFVCPGFEHGSVFQVLEINLEFVHWVQPHLSSKCSYLSSVAICQDSTCYKQSHRQSLLPLCVAG